MGTNMGTIASLRHYPVKSMGGEELQAAELTEYGLLGDRAYAVINGKSMRAFVLLARKSNCFAEPCWRAVPEIRSHSRSTLAKIESAVAVQTNGCACLFEFWT